MKIETDMLRILFLWARTKLNLLIYHVGEWSNKNKINQTNKKRRIQTSVPKKYFPLSGCTGIPSLDAKFLSSKTKKKKA